MLASASSRRVSVPELARPTRLDQYLVEASLASTRSQAKRSIQDGLVRVNGRVGKPSQLLRGGEGLEIEPRPEAEEPLVAEPLPVTVLYADDDVLAVDKPAGLVVHPGAGRRHGTLVNALLHHRLVEPVSGFARDRPGIVHRLDKETSGVLLVARTLQAYNALSKAFQTRSVEKTYVALVVGKPARDAGEITWAVGRHRRERARMSIHSARGRPARTAYRVLEALPGVTLLELRPETGRTHQIRVHLAAMGHPVLGDPLYGARGRRRVVPRNGLAGDCPRQALHAAAVRFPHPRTGVPTDVRSELPQDLAHVVRRLRAALEGERLR